MEQRTLLGTLSIILYASLFFGFPVMATGGVSGPGRTLDPVVSTDWLAANAHLAQFGDR